MICSLVPEAKMLISFTFSNPTNSISDEQNQQNFSYVIVINLFKF